MLHGQAGLPARACRSTALALALAGTLGGCVPDLTGLRDIVGRPGGLIDITVYPASVVVQVGDTVRMSATGTPEGLLAIVAYDALPDAVWKISDPRVAKLDPVPVPATDSFPSARVRVQGLRTGEARVTVSARGVSDTAHVRVVATPDR